MQLYATGGTYGSVIFRARVLMPLSTSYLQYMYSQSQSQFIKDKRLHVNTRNIQRQLYPCTATAEVVYSIHTVHAEYA